MAEKEGQLRVEARGEAASLKAPVRTISFEDLTSVAVEDVWTFYDSKGNSTSSPDGVIGHLELPERDDR